MAAWTCDAVQRWQDEFAASLPTRDADLCDVTFDPTGNVYSAGYGSTLDGEDVAVVKYSPAGVRLWTSSYDGPAHGSDNCRAVTYGHGGLFAAGIRSTTMVDTSALLIRYAP